LEIRKNKNMELPTTKNELIYTIVTAIVGVIVRAIEKRHLRKCGKLNDRKLNNKAENDNKKHY
jgi:hypothetical protein